MVKNLPTKQERRVLSLGPEYSLEKEMVTHSSILAWEIPWTQVSGRLQSMGSQKSVLHNDLVTAQRNKHTQTSVFDQDE